MAWLLVPTENRSFAITSAARVKRRRHLAPNSGSDYSRTAPISCCRADNIWQMKISLYCMRVAYLFLLLVLAEFSPAANLSAQAQSKTLKALVGGTLIDGY